jgi:transposase-like protein
VKVDTKKRKKATSGFRQMTGEEQAIEILFKTISQGKQALDAVFLDMGKMMAESIMLIEREELSGPDYQPTDPNLKKWAHEKGSAYIGDQKTKVSRPRLRNVDQGQEVPLKSYQAMHGHGGFSDDLLTKILSGVSAQKYRETVLDAASAFGVSSSTVSRKMVEITAKKLQAFQDRDLSDFHPFAIFMDGINRGGETFLVALGLDKDGNKKPLGFWQGSTENHEICEELFKNLEKRGLPLSKRVLWITDGGSGVIKALRARYGKKLLHQRCAIHKSRNLQSHLAKKYRKEAHRLLMNALEQNCYEDAKAMMKELEKWLRSKNESAANSLLEAFEELLTLHRLKVPALLRKTLITTNPIESMFSLVRHCESNIKRTRGTKMLQRWLASVLLYCEQRFHKVRGYQEISAVVSNIEDEINKQKIQAQIAA